jgi:glutathione S-transferase
MMQLIGMLDSPFVRRVAISLQLLGLRFEHRSLSVFRTFERFSELNPVVKAPTFVCDDGTVLMDSTLILDHAEQLAQPRTLMPTSLPERTRALRAIGLALAGCEKTAQIVYERGLRPPEKQHQPWIDRVSRQLRAAYAALEDEARRADWATSSEAIDQAGLTAAVAWHFTQQMLPEIVIAAEHPTLVAYSEQAEALPEFRAAPHGDGTVAAMPVSS